MNFFQSFIGIILDALLGLRRQRKMKKVLLDAGHGGTDSGAVANDVLEKDITLDMVMAIGRILEKQVGVEVHYTRIGDKSLSLTGRLEAIMNINPDAFISIHCNAIADNPNTKQDECQTVHGTEIFYRDDNDLPLAWAINHLFGHSGIWRKNRGIKQDQEWLKKRLAVLNNLEVPSVLVEIGFISNQLECMEILRNEIEIANLIAHGIVDFLKKGEDENG